MKYWHRPRCSRKSLDKVLREGKLWGSWDKQAIQIQRSSWLNFKVSATRVGRIQKPVVRFKFKFHRKWTAPILTTGVRQKKFKNLKLKFKPSPHFHLSKVLKYPIMIRPVLLLNWKNKWVEIRLWRYKFQIDLLLLVTNTLFSLKVSTPFCKKVESLWFQRSKFSFEKTTLI